MPLRNILPLHILRQENIPHEYTDGIWMGIARVLLLAEVYTEFEIKHLNQRRDRKHISPDGNVLVPHRSLDWYIDIARQESKKDGYLNSLKLLNSLRSHPTFDKKPRYELVILKEPLHFSNESQRHILGIGRRGQGAVISLSYYLPLLQPVPGETAEYREKRIYNFLLHTKMLVMHELGHVFGLFPGTGKTDPTDQELKESHCQNECVMYWEENAALHEKIAKKPFCSSCEEKLKQFFITP